MTKDHFESVPYNHPQFPIYIQKEKFYASKPFISHINWHTDIEFVKILSGSINYCIDGEIINLTEGEGLYINSNRVHYNYSADNEDCVFLCVVFHPSFLCAKKHYEDTYILPILANEALPYYVLRKDISWEKQITDFVDSICNAASNTEFELKLHSAFFSMWECMYKNLCKKKKNTLASNESASSFKKMVSYIQLHYKEKITLDEISSAGNVCKTTCNKIFKIYTGCTPIEYLTDHRLRRAIEFIESNDLTLTQICYECGFGGASYFAETFKKVFGVSPKKYKLKHEKNTSGFLT